MGSYPDEFPFGIMEVVELLHLRVRAHLSFLPSYPRRGPYQPAFCSESKTSWAAARTMLFLLLPGIR